MSIICKRYDLFTNRTETIEQSLVDAYLKQQNTLLWIEVRLPVDGELDWLGQTFSLQPATMQSIQAKDGYPSFVWNEKYYVFTSTAMYFAEQHLIHDPVYIICSHNYIITVEYHPIGFLADVRR
jgi:Mg2+ and Co2+ transporter CorA